MLLSSTVGVFGEIDSVNLTQGGPNDWAVIQMDREYKNPVVVVGPVSNEGQDPAVIRVRNVTSTSFELQIDEWDYLDGGHIEETIGYAVVEAGRHRFADGTLLEAGTLPAVGGPSWTTGSLLSGFTSAPIVLSSVSSAIEPDAVTPPHRNITSSGFDTLLQEQEADDQVHAGEVLSYLAIESGYGDGWDASTFGGVTNQQKSVPLIGGFTDIPVFLGSIQTFNGFDTSALRYGRVNNGTVSMWLNIEEEKSKDTETKHGAETVGYLAHRHGDLTGESWDPASSGWITPIGNLNRPTDVRVTAEGNSLWVRWQDNAEGESGYVVETSFDGGNTWGTSAKLGADTVQHTLVGLALGAEVGVRVGAIASEGDGEGADSPTTQPAGGKVVTGPVATDGLYVVTLHPSIEGHASFKKGGTDWDQLRLRGVEGPSNETQVAFVEAGSWEDAVRKSLHGHLKINVTFGPQAGIKNYTYAPPNIEDLAKWSPEDEGFKIVPFAGNFPGIPIDARAVVLEDQHRYDGKGYTSDGDFNDFGAHLEVREAPRLIDLDVDLDRDGLTGDEANHEILEASLGAILLANNDDDNGGGTRDFEEDERIAHEDDLLRLSIRQIDPPDQATQVRLRFEDSFVPPSTRVGIWETPERRGYVMGRDPGGGAGVTEKVWDLDDVPHDLWVEGIGASFSERDVVLVAEYLDEEDLPLNTRDSVAFTTANAQIDIVAPGELNVMAPNTKQAPGAAVQDVGGVATTLKVNRAGPASFQRRLNYDLDKLLVTGDPDGLNVLLPDTILENIGLGGEAVDLYAWSKTMEMADVERITVDLVHAPESPFYDLSLEEFEDFVSVHRGAIDIVQTPKFLFAAAKYATPIKFQVLTGGVDNVDSSKPEPVSVRSVTVTLDDPFDDAGPFLDAIDLGELVRFGPGDGSSPGTEGTYSVEWTAFVPAWMYKQFNTAQVAGDATSNARWTVKVAYVPQAGLPAGVTDPLTLMSLPLDVDARPAVYADSSVFAVDLQPADVADFDPYSLETDLDGAQLNEVSRGESASWRRKGAAVTYLGDGETQTVPAPFDAEGHFRNAVGVRTEEGTGRVILEAETTLKQDDSFPAADEGDIFISRTNNLLYGGMLHVSYPGRELIGVLNNKDGNPNPDGSMAMDLDHFGGEVSVKAFEGATAEVETVGTIRHDKTVDGLGVTSAAFGIASAFTGPLSMVPGPVGIVSGIASATFGVIAGALDLANSLEPDPQLLPDDYTSVTFQLEGRVSHHTWASGGKLALQEKLTSLDDVEPNRDPALPAQSAKIVDTTRSVAVGDQLTYSLALGTSAVVKTTKVASQDPHASAKARVIFSDETERTTWEIKARAD